MLVDPRKPRADDPRLDLKTIVTGVVVPIAVALIATQVDVRRAVVLAAVAVVAMVLGMVPHLHERFRRSVGRRSDARLARELMPTIKDLFSRFGHFTYADRSDNLHWVLNNDLRDAHSVVASLKVADQHTFHSWWYALDRRVQSGSASIAEAIAAVDDLHTLINAYKRACFDPVFDRPSKEFLAALDSRVASELESVRERLNAYLARVEELADRLSKQTTSIQPQRFWIDRPKPLRASLAPVNAATVQTGTT